MFIGPRKLTQRHAPPHPGRSYMCECSMPVQVSLHPFAPSTHEPTHSKQDLKRPLGRDISSSIYETLVDFIAKRKIKLKECLTYGGMSTSFQLACPNSVLKKNKIFLSAICLQQMKTNTFKTSNQKKKDRGFVSHALFIHFPNISFHFTTVSTRPAKSIPKYSNQSSCDSAPPAASSRSS